MSGIPGWMIDFGLFAGIFGFFVLGYFLMLENRRERVFQKRIARFRGASSSSPHRLSGGATTSSLKRRTGDEGSPILSRITAMVPNRNSLQSRLERAGKTTSPGRFMLVCAGIMLFTALTVAALGKPILLGIFLGIITGIGLPHFYLNFITAQRLKKFILLFPDGIDLIVRGLRAGLPVGESVNMVAREVPDPVGCTFAAISDSVRLGVTLEKAFTDTAKKLNCTEFNFFTTSIILQRETGGNLSEILNNLSDVLRKRVSMRMKIKALSSEAKASAYIVGSLPFVVLLALSVISPKYLEPLWQDFRGNMAALAAIASLGTGVTIMMKMAKFEL